MWSLAHEWFFYLLYPILLWLAYKNKGLPIILVITLFISFLLGIKIPYIGSAAYTLLIWCLGALLAEIYARKKENIGKYLPYLLLLGIAYFFIDRIDKNTVYLDLIFGLVMMAMLYLIIKKKITFINQILAKFSWLGTFSYSIYLLHFPLLNTYKYFLIHFSSTKTYLFTFGTSFSQF
jgi:peptidoglycan/LPS O-acetylase OafA/YrhL